MIENKELYSFTDIENTPGHEEGQPAPDEAEEAAESGFPYKTVSHIITSIFCLILILIIIKADYSWADWTRAKLHTAINASSESTFGYISNSVFFKSLITTFSPCAVGSVETRRSTSSGPILKLNRPS